MEAQLLGFPPRSLCAGTLPTSYELEVEWRSRRLDLVRGAVMAERFAFSYRQLVRRHRTRIARCGAVVFGYRRAETYEDKFGLGFGWNTKFLSKAWPSHLEKLCSERGGIRHLHDQSFDNVYGLVNFSDNMQTDDVSGVFCNIQHPCYECRKFLEKHLRPSAPIILVRHRLPCDLDPSAQYLDDLIIEDWTFGEICRHHNYRAGLP